MSELKPMIQVFSNSLGEEEVQAIQKVFASRWLGKGKHCEELEKELATYFQVPQILLFNCCTSAIYAALRALKVGKGDEVIVSTVNFVACANAVIDFGAKPVFADVDPATFNILPEEIDRLKTPKTKGVIILHYGGHPCDFDALREVAGEKLFIFEDSANSVASTYKGRHCGTLGDAGACSFDAMKILVMGDGGALYVRDPEVFQKAFSYRDLGYRSSQTSGVKAQQMGQDRWWEYDLDVTSGRFISNDILASIGRIQLKKLPEFIKRREVIWNYYQQELASVNGILTPPSPLPGCTSSYYFFWLKIAGKRDELAKFLKEKGIYCTFRYYPLHMVKHYQNNSRLPNAEQIQRDALNIPVHQNLSDGEVDYIVSSIKEFSRTSC